MAGSDEHRNRLFLRQRQFPGHLNRLSATFSPVCLLRRRARWSGSAGMDQPRQGEVMEDMCTYLIHLQGQVDAGELNAMSPLAMTLERVEPAATVLAFSTDQSG